MGKRIFKILILFLIFILIKNVKSQSGFDGNRYINRIVSFEMRKLNTDTINKFSNISYKPYATGFFINSPNHEYGDNIFLITCKHVMQTIIKYDYDIIIRLPYKDTINNIINSVRLIIPLDEYTKKLILFSNDTCYDVAVLAISKMIIKETDPPDFNFNLNKLVWGNFPFSEIRTNNDTIRTLDEVIFMGYPFGLSGEHKNFLIYRYGVISAIIDENYVDLCGNHYLINCISEGGDSGSPVEVFSLNPILKNFINYKLIGVLSGDYFKGLSVIEPIESVMEIIYNYLNSFKK